VPIDNRCAQAECENVEVAVGVNVAEGHRLVFVVVVSEIETSFECSVWTSLPDDDDRSSNAAFTVRVRRNHIFGAVTVEVSDEETVRIPPILHIDSDEGTRAVVPDVPEASIGADQPSAVSPRPGEGIALLVGEEGKALEIELVPLEIGYGQRNSIGLARDAMRPPSLRERASQARVRSTSCGRTP
jgi:hypothetical protein